MNDPRKRIYIKNMVCPRCIRSVEQILDYLQMETVDIQLGQVLLSEKPSKADLSALARELEKAGFQLLDDHASQLINRIKSIIINEIHYAEERSPVNMSSLLSDKLHYDYSYLSRLFSSVEGRTIENFAIIQKIEKAKELLFYGQKTLEEIAFDLHYSSAPHLSSQFKKVTGMTPSQFRRRGLGNRKSLDEL